MHVKKRELVALPVNNVSKRGTNNRDCAILLRGNPLGQHVIEQSRIHDPHEPLCITSEPKSLPELDERVRNDAFVDVQKLRLATLRLNGFAILVEKRFEVSHWRPSLDRGVVEMDGNVHIELFLIRNAQSLAKSVYGIDLCS